MRRIVMMLPRRPVGEGHMKETVGNAPILIVNYHRDLNEAFERVLKQHGYDATIADTLSKATAFLLSNRVQGVILRNAMPDGTSREVAVLAWKHQKVPTIGLTERLTREQMRARVGCEGFKDALVLPVAMEELVFTVESVFGSPASTCPQCRGAGAQLLFVRLSRCTRCQGRGWVNSVTLQAV